MADDKAFYSVLRSPQKYEFEILNSTLIQISKRPISENPKLIHFILKSEISNYLERKNENISKTNENSSPINTYHKLLLQLISSNATYTLPVLTKIIDELIHSNVANVLECSSYLALVRMMEVVPAAAVHLAPTLNHKAPHPSSPTHELTNYVTISLALLNNSNKINNKCDKILNDLNEDESKVAIWANLLNFVIEMDLMILIQKNGNLLLNLKNDSNDDSSNNDKNSCKPADEHNKILELANKLDKIMTILLQFIQNSNNLVQIFKFLKLNIQKFANFPDLKFVQFLVYVVLELDAKKISANSIEGSTDNSKNYEPLYRDYLSNLLQTIYLTNLDDGATILSNNTVINSTAYCASFLARANFVDAETIVECLNYLADCSIYFINSTSTDPPNTMSTNHLLKNKNFYSVTQAIFYILCYQMRRLVNSNNKDFDVVFNQKLKFILSEETDLKPLKYCLGSVVEEFEVLARKFDFVPDQLFESYHQSLNSRQNVKKKKKIHKITSPGFQKSNSTSRKSKIQNPLESFFPFDPYLLKESSKYIDGYIYWDDVIEEENSLASEDSDSSLSELESDDESVDVEEDLNDQTTRDDVSESTRGTKRMRGLSLCSEGSF